MSTNTIRFGSGSRAQRPLPVPAPIRNPITLLFLFAAKSDPRLLAVCSRWAIATQTALGFFVLASAILAFASAFCVLSTLNVSAALVPWLAAGYAVWVAVLEREISGSLDRTTAIVRPFLALFIASLVSIPLELFIFQARVDQELSRQYRENNHQQIQDLDAAQHHLDQRRAELDVALTDLRTQETAWGKIMDDELVGRPKPGRTGVRGVGPVFENAERQQAGVRQRIQELRHDLDRIDHDIPEERLRIEDNYRRVEINRSVDFVTRYEALNRVVHSSAPLYRLSWLIVIALALVETMTACLKLFTPHSDYHHLVLAEIRERRARIDELGDRNFRLAMENPETPRLSVVEKFIIAWYTSPNTSSFEKKYETKTEA